MIRQGIDTTYNCSNWQALWSELEPVVPPFSSPAYYKAWQTLEDAQIECFWAQQDEYNFLFYPYLKKSINVLGYSLGHEYNDVSGAYGYNGPIGQAQDTLFLEAYNRNLRDYFDAQNIVTEFVRYCPLTGNRSYHTYTDQIQALDNVFIDLSGGPDQVWNESFEYRVRKTVRKGQTHGLRTEIKQGTQITEQDLASFYSIYTSTMARNGAEGFYYFPLDFFRSLVHNLGEMALLAITYWQDKAVTAELVLVSGTLAYGFLGGTVAEYYQYKANTFQRWELVKRLCELGVSKYSMGGGASRGDSIYEFKLSFARGCNNPFYIGTHVHLPEVYAEIQSQWRKLDPQAVLLHAHKIQGYRIKV